MTLLFLLLIVRNRSYTSFVLGYVIPTLTHYHVGDVFVMPPMRLIVFILVVYWVVKVKAHIGVFFTFVLGFVYKHVGPNIVVMNVEVFHLCWVHRCPSTFLLVLHRVDMCCLIVSRYPSFVSDCT